MKKFLGAIISGLAGVLSLVFLSLPVLSFDYGIGDKETASGWKVLTDEAWGKADMTAVTWYRIFAWVLVVLAVVLIVMAVLQLLSALGVIKMPAILNTVNTYALIALAVVSILALVANFGIRAEMVDAVEPLGKEAVKAAKEAYGVGASLWVVSIVNIIAGICGKVFKAKD